MIFSRFCAMAALVTGCVTAVPASAAVNLLSNGSFESGISPGGFTTIFAGDASSITGWTVVNGSVDYIGSYWQASNGSKSIDLSGNSPGTIAHALSGLTVGARYQVSFDIAGNPDGAPTIKSVNVSVGGGTQNFTFDDTGSIRPAPFGWQGRSFSFVAGSTTDTLSFVNLTAGPYGAALDNVAVAAVPEPSTWALMLAGLAGLGFVARRRRWTSAITA